MDIVDKRVPSRCSSTYWLQATSRHSSASAGLSNWDIGKFLIFEPRQYIDSSWERIKTATEAGQLGFASKVSTRRKKPDDIVGGNDEHAICVYARNSSDSVELERIRESLYRLGYSEYLPYKTDASTLRGAYSHKYCFTQGPFQKSGHPFAAQTDNTSQPGAAGNVTNVNTEQSQSTKRPASPDPHPRPSKIPRADQENRHQNSPDPSSSSNIANPDIIETPEPVLLVTERGIYPRKPDWKPILYISTYFTDTEYNHYCVHVKQKVIQSNADILFPFEQLKAVLNSVYQLGRSFILNNEEIVRGIETSHVKLHVGYSDRIRTICIHFTNMRGVTVVFPQTHFMYYWKRLDGDRKQKSYGNKNYRDHGIETDEQELSDDELVYPPNF